MLAYTVKLLTSKLKEELKMKKLLIFAALPLFIAAGCTTQYQAKAPYDDVYYSSRDIPAATSSKVVVKQVQAPAVSDYTSANNGENTQDASQQADNQTSGATEYLNYQEQPAGVMTESYVEPGGGSSVTNNFYGDYYDYAYASRLRRFHSNSYMDSYYDPYYSNMYYYDYNPWSWGTSIYFNSGWSSGTKTLQEIAARNAGDWLEVRSQRQRETVDALQRATEINKQFPQLSFERCLDMIGTGTSKNTSPKTEQTITTI